MPEPGPTVTRVANEITPSKIIFMDDKEFHPLLRGKEFPTKAVAGWYESVANLFSNPEQPLTERIGGFVKASVDYANDNDSLQGEHKWNEWMVAAAHGANEFVNNHSQEAPHKQGMILLVAEAFKKVQAALTGMDNADERQKALGIATEQFAAITPSQEHA